MPRDEALEGRVRAALAAAGPVREVAMFGGLGFMLNGNMVATASQRGLLVRVGEEGVAEALARGAEPMVMGGRTMKGFVVVTGKLDAHAVASWLKTARGFVERLPAGKLAAGKLPAKKLPAKKATANSRRKKS